jgi:hypothetical protein
MATDFEGSYRQRRHRGFWRKLRNPRTWRNVVQVALIIYRLAKWLAELFGSWW